MSEPVRVSAQKCVDEVRSLLWTNVGIIRNGKEILRGPAAAQCTSSGLPARSLQSISRGAQYSGSRQDHHAMRARAAGEPRRPLSLRFPLERRSRTRQAFVCLQGRSGFLRVDSFQQSVLSIQFSVFSSQPLSLSSFPGADLRQFHRRLAPLGQRLQACKIETVVMQAREFTGLPHRCWRATVSRSTWSMQAHQDASGRKTDVCECSGCKSCTPLAC